MSVVTPVGPPEDAHAEMASRQFVTFTVHGETFAVPLAEVQEIIRMPDAVRLPLSPPSLEGLANLRGTVLPVINLRTVFGCEAHEHDDTTRVVVLDQGRPVGLVVDRMANVVTVEADRIEPADHIGSSVESDLLTGMIKGADQSMVMILDAAALVRREIRSIGRREAEDAAAAGARDRDAVRQEAASDEIQLVSFVVAGQEYAFPIEHVQEIVQVPARITRVPNADGCLLGVITLRDRLLPLVSLRSLFSLPDKALSEQDRIVVISLGRGSRDEVAVGVVMDSVKEVLRVARALVDAVPSLLARDQHLQDLTAICRLDAGKRLVSVLSAERMFRHPAIRDAADAAAASEDKPMVEDRKPRQDSAADEEEQFVVFRLLAEEYGVAIDSVQEIVRVPEQLTQIPHSPAFIEGVVNLRGTVLPVVDQRRRFGLPGCDRSDRQRIMVFNIRGARTGFIVDSVSEVTRIPRSAIGPAPDLSEEQSRMIRRVANLEKQNRMILLLDVDELLGAGEVAELAKG